MANLDIDKVTEQLAQTIIEQDGVSFLGKSLKLDSEDDAKEIVEALNQCTHLEYFNLEGNTLGVNAARAIAKCLESHGELKRALWKDMFTGRMKTEIPKALDFLGSGLILGGAQLTELDLSDNAFGPIGVNGLATLLKSPTCYSLQIFKLNNNGLGINGGKILSQALIECYEKSKLAGSPLALRVFIAGRNRLENEGAQNLAKFFKKVGTLEELMMPQNGIYHVGVKAICDALKHNTKLKVLNLNDNTLTVKGALSMSQTLPLLKDIKYLNFGDCLLKTKGAILIAEAIKDHIYLEELHMESNEIKILGGISIVDCMNNKKSLKTLNLVGNYFGVEGRKKIKEILEKSNQLKYLESMSDDEDVDDDDDEDDDDDDNDEDDDDDDNNNEDEEEEEVDGEEKIKDRELIIDQEIKNESKLLVENYTSIKEEVNATFNNKSNENSDNILIKFSDFIETPLITRDNFLKLGNQRNEILLNEFKKYNEQGHINESVALIMKISSLALLKDKSICNDTKECSLILYKELINWAQSHKKISSITDTLLIHLGLLKSEDKNFKIVWNLESCFKIITEVFKQNLFPESITDTIKLFIERFEPKVKINQKN